MLSAAAWDSTLRPTRDDESSKPDGSRIVADLDFKEQSCALTDFVLPSADHSKQVGHDSIRPGQPRRGDACSMADRFATQRSTGAAGPQSAFLGAQTRVPVQPRRASRHRREIFRRWRSSPEPCESGSTQIDQTQLIA